MESTQIRALYTLKESANEHLKNKEYQSSAVYFIDILSKFNKAMEKIQSEQDMQRIIKQIKLPCHKNLSLCHLKLGQNQACITQCQQTLKIDPNCLKVIYRIGKAYMGLKQYDEAQKYLKRGFAIDPHEDEILKALAQIQASRNSKPAKQQSIITLKSIILLILYYPLLILNTILSKIFGEKARRKVDEDCSKDE